MDIQAEVACFQKRKRIVHLNLFEFQESQDVEMNLHQFLLACTQCAYVLMHVSVWDRKGAHAFSCLFVFERREPWPVTEVKPQLSDSLVNGGGLGSGLSGGGVKKMERVNDGGGGKEREAHARQFPWRWVIHRHRKCLTSHPEKCPQRLTCVKGVIEHN